jgi:light-harvesting protein B-800-850 alpha chain
MNQGRIWTVVNPNHGLPLFLGSVALMSFTIHYAILSNSSWYKEFFNGNMNKVASVETKVDPTADLASTTTPAVRVDSGQSAALVLDRSTTPVVKANPKTNVSAVPG